MDESGRDQPEAGDRPVPDRMCHGKLGSYAGSCLRPGTVEHDGKWYCWQHDPEKLRAKAEQARRDYIEKQRLDDLAFEKKLARRRLEEAAGLGLLTDDELTALATLGGVRAAVKLLQPYLRLLAAAHDRHRFSTVAGDPPTCLNCGRVTDGDTALLTDLCPRAERPELHVRMRS